MQAYHNKPKLKDKIINQLQMHYDHDQIVQGIYWENGKGCALGCIMQRDNSGNIHAEMQKELGIIQPLPRLIDRIFEGLDNKIAKEFPLKIMQAIQVGKDLSNVWSKFVVWLLIDDKYGVIKHAKTYAAKDAINNVAALYERKLKGDAVEMKEWQEARKAAYAAADAAYAAYAADAADAAAYAADAAAYAADAAAYAAAAYAAAYAAAAYAADAAAYAAAAYAADAADAAAYAAAAYAADAAYAAARKNHYKVMADKLIELIS